MANYIIRSQAASKLLEVGIAVATMNRPAHGSSIAKIFAPIDNCFAQKGCITRDE